MLPVIFVAVALGSGPAGPVAATSEWVRSSPEEAGMDRAALDALDRELADGKHGYVDTMLVIRHGRIVVERAYRHDYVSLFEGRGAPGIYNYYDPDWHPWYRHGTLHTLQSVTKSITSALVGIALGRGELPDVDVPVARFFDTYSRPDADPRRDRIALRDLLTMRAGIAWDESSVDYTDPANSCARMEASDDWVQFVLDQPMADEPGSRFVYSSGVSELLAQVLKQATGVHVDAYAEQHLFGPLGIDRYYWKKTPTGHPDTEGGLYLSARDLARIGELYLHDGVWHGRRLLPEGWVARSTAPLVDVSPKGDASIGYGFQWWSYPWGDGHHAIAGDGYGGQVLLVVPEAGLVAVFNGWNIHGGPELSPKDALHLLLPALRPSVP